MKDKILITGGAGYIGSKLIDIFPNKKKLKIIDSFYYCKQFLKKKKIKCHSENINNKINDKIFKKVKTVVHLAGLANDSTSDLNPNLTVLTNHISTIKLAKQAKRLGVKKFIYASSCSVYGDQDKKLVNENYKLRPLTIYALSKASSELEIQNLNSKNFKVISLRFATLFGLSPRMRFDLGINAMTKNVIKNINLIVNGNGKQYRSFVHVRDVAKTILFFINKKSPKIKYSIFNVGSNSLNIRIIDLANKIKKKFKKIKILFNKDQADFRSYRADFSRLNKIFNTAKFMTIEDGVKEIYEYYKYKKINLDNPIYYNLKTMKRKNSTMAKCT